MPILQREVLNANRTYYVRTNGSDSNSGLTNDAAGALLTIQKAIDVVCNQIDNAGYTVTIQVADGTYNQGLSLKPYVGSGAVTLQGNTTTPANVTITVASGATHTIDVKNGNCLWHIAGLKLANSGTGRAINMTSSQLTFANLDFATCSNEHIFVARNSYCTATSNYSISGGALRHIVVTQGSTHNIDSITITISGTPAFAAFSLSTQCGILRAYSISFPGTATGKRYEVETNGVINTYGGGANYFPGNAAGTTATGGQYT